VLIEWYGDNDNVQPDESSKDLLTSLVDIR